MRKYIAIGSVRGWCGHYHRTALAAHKCAMKDNREVQRYNGNTAYSDRVVVTINNPHGHMTPSWREPLTDEELDIIDEYEYARI